MQDSKVLQQQWAWQKKMLKLYTRDNRRKAGLPCRSCGHIQVLCQRLGATRAAAAAATSAAAAVTNGASSMWLLLLNTYISRRMHSAAARSSCSRTILHMLVRQLSDLLMLVC
jgi:hypothetical protein